MEGGGGGGVKEKRAGGRGDSVTRAETQKVNKLLFGSLHLRSPVCLSVPGDEVELTDLLYVNEYAAADARLVPQSGRSGHAAALCLWFCLTHLRRQW